MPASCPPYDELARFSFGHLNTLPAEEIATHIDSCASCRTVMEEISRTPDPLAAALRAPRELPFAEEAALAAALPNLQEFVHEIGRDASVGVEQTAATIAPTAAISAAKLKAIRDYEILEKLGEGGMGAVYKARHSRLKKIVAIKVLPRDRVAGEDAIARFEREMEAVGKLEHPHLVRAMDAGEADGTHFLVMEYVGGPDLSQLVKQQGPLRINDACELIRQAAVGLQHVHEQGLVHRDIKPSNLMLSPTGNVKILDLGLALLSGDGSPGGRELTTTGQMMGTIDYMAPEQGGDTHNVDIRADIYSLGASLYKLLTGVAPFGDAKFDTPVKKLMALAVQDPIPIRDRRPEIPAILAAVVTKMLAKDPKDRYANPAAVAEALAPFTADSDLVALAVHVAGTGARTYKEDTYVSLKSASVDTLAPNISPSPTRPRSPLPLVRNIALGVIASALLAAALVFFIPTPHGNVKVTINDPSISVKFDKTGATIEDGDSKPIKLKFGEQGIVIKRGDFEFLTTRFKLEKKGETTLDIELLPGEVKVVYDGQLIERKRFAELPRLAATATPPAQPNTHELQFASGDKVEIPSLLIDRADPVTFEAFVTPEAKFESTVLLVGAPFHAICIERTQHWQFNWISDQFRIVGARPVELGRRLHMAGVRAADRMELFVDGRSTGRQEVKPAQRFSFAVTIGGDGFVGRIDEVRVSSIARYNKNFPPPLRFGSDDQTIALYHCDEGQGTELKDSSGNGHHGKIAGAKWVRTSSTPSYIAPERVVAPFNATAAKAHQQAWADYLGMKVETENSLGGKMVLIPPGEFLMGSTDEEIEAALKIAESQQADEAIKDFIRKGERPQHRVVLTKPFLIGEAEVTVGQFREFVKATKHVTDAEQSPSRATGKEVGKTWQSPGYKNEDNYAVRYVSWNDATAFCAWLSKRENATYRLPTEAEWEFACRAGTTTQYSFGDDASLIGRFAWNSYNTAGGNPVVSKPANPFGLYAMHSIPWEWCQDFGDEDSYDSITVTDPVGRSAGERRIVRGGHFSFYAVVSRSAFRFPLEPSTFAYYSGFRVVKVLDDSVSAPSASARTELKRGEHFTLEFDGLTTHVLVPTLKPETDRPLTLEALVKVSPELKTPSVIASAFIPTSSLSLVLSDQGFPLFLTRRNQESQASSFVSEMKSGDWLHIAGVWDGKTTRLFLHGRPLSSTVPVVTPPATESLNQHFTIGAQFSSEGLPASAFFRGQLDEIRLSKVARYDGEFKPLQIGERFVPDEHTLALYHCDEGQGAQLIDSSGKNHHGEIVGAKWARADVAAE